MTWDHLGRLTAVTDAAGTTTYTYDPLDRLRTVDYGGGNRIRFRYVGLTTSAAQWLDDVAGTVTRSIGNGWTGERLMDWTGTSSNRRYYGTNAHHDVTWLADSAGAVSQSLRYDPWGTPRSTVPTGYTPFRFQGSWYDATTDLSWVVTRWYAEGLGRFVSEDTLLGEPREPDSRHLYAYAAGEPVGAWDPDGRAVNVSQRINLSKWHGIVKLVALGAIAALSCPAFVSVGLFAGAWVCAREIAGITAEGAELRATPNGGTGLTVEAFVRQRIRTLAGNGQTVQWTHQVGTRSTSWKNWRKQKVVWTWARFWSAEYYETFVSSKQDRSKLDFVGRSLNSHFNACGGAFLGIDALRDWGPDSVDEAKGKSHGRCHPWAAAIYVRKDPMQAEGVQWAVTTRWHWDQYYTNKGLGPVNIPAIKW